jgi:hypothetical protein
LSPANEKSSPRASSLPAPPAPVGNRNGIAEAEQPRALVERLAGRVVERLAQQLVAVMVLDATEQRVAAARDQRHERRLERLGREEARRDVALEVIDGREWQPAGGGDALRGAEADQQRADQARPLRRGDELDVVEPRAGFGERRIDDGVDELEVVARRDLGDDAAEAVVNALRRDHVRERRPVDADERSAGVVAAGLEREDHCRLGVTGSAFGMSSRLPLSVAGVRHMIRASSPLSW